MIHKESFTSYDIIKLMNHPKWISLNSILQQAPFSWQLQGSDVSANGVQMDSRHVQPGMIFAAIQGEISDGHDYIPQAVEKGAAAVIGTREIKGLPVPYIKVADSRSALAYLAAAYQGFPAEKLVLMGITGTDGKTTTANMLYHILRAAHYPVGIISTVNAVFADQAIDTGFHVTTPDAPAVQDYLAQMLSMGATHVILEATSHGLAQSRLASNPFDYAILTNITHEHLDYHHTFEEYRSAKSLLFSGLMEGLSKDGKHPRAAVLNQDDTSFPYLRAITSVPVVSYGLNSNADIYASQISMQDKYMQFVVAGIDLHNQRFQFEVCLALLGEYNIYNALAAIALTRGVLGIESEHIQAGFVSLKDIPGRMEKIELGQDFVAMVDFAHTPNALKRALQSSRKLTNGRLIAVFGSAGLRDREKRRLMAEVSAELADLTILTAEDPRSESLDQILKEMAEGMQSKSLHEGEHYWRIPDRREAIRFAVRLAQPGDLVILCGKGHEQSMCFGSTEYAWDDRIALRVALAELLGISTLESMPYLPDPDDYLDILTSSSEP